MTKKQLKEKKQIDSNQMKIDSYQLICESLSQPFYHGSSIQNLTVLSPRKKSFRFKTDSPRVFVTDDITYASAFTWNWTNSDGIELGRINNGPYMIEIPKKFKSIVSKGNCSIYIVKGDFKQIKSQPMEYFTKSDIPVLKEVKYSSPLEAMKKNGLVVKWI